MAVNYLHGSTQRVKHLQQKHPQSKKNQKRNTLVLMTSWDNNNKEEECNFFKKMKRKGRRICCHMLLPELWWHHGPWGGNTTRTHALPVSYGMRAAVSQGRKKIGTWTPQTPWECLGRKSWRGRGHIGCESGFLIVCVRHLWGACPSIKSEMTPQSLFLNMCLAYTRKLGWVEDPPF